MPPGAAFVIAIILLSAAGFVLVLLYKVLLWRAERRADREWMPTRRARRPLPTRSVMSRARYVQMPTERAKAPVYLVKLNTETAEIPQPVAENSSETFTFGETQALARLVAAGKLGLTDAVKIGADAKSGEKYQKRSQEIKAAVAQIQERYPRQTPDQAANREALGLNRQN